MMLSGPGHICISQPTAGGDQCIGQENAVHLSENFAFCSQYVGKQTLMKLS